MKDIRWLQKEFPEAYEALPQCYRNDNCLRFNFDEENQTLVALPNETEVEVLGNWVAFWNTNKWIEK